MSDLSAFTTYKENASMFVGIDPAVVDVISGSGSLRVNRNGVSATKLNLMRSVGQRAFTSAVARFRVKPLAKITNDQWGFVFQQSTGDLTGAAGTAYFCRVDTQASNTAVLTISRLTTGLGTQVTLQSSSSLTYAVGTVLAIELTWILDVANLGGIHFIVKHDTNGSASYSSLTTDLDFVSTSTVLTTSQGEGPALSLNSVSSSGDYLMKIDSVIPLLVGG